MKRPAIILLILFAFLPILVGQNQHLEGTFAYVYNPDRYKDAEINSLPNASIQKVFDDLVRAKGVSTTLSPKLELVNSESMAAWAKPLSRTIGIEQKAYDICRSLGADSLNAVAGLLAHELIHYYENHDWHNHFIRHYTPLRDEEFVDNNSGKQMEMEADEMGGLLAQMAGYNSLKIMPVLLRKIYAAYGLDDQASSHYPNLESRIEMADISRDNLSKLIPIFEMANYLIVTGAEEEAQFYLEYILNNSRFQSRELHNNLGVLYALRAYDNRPDQNSKFYLPFQLDLSSRLSTKGMADDNFNKYCEWALQKFENALHLDKEYTAAMINMAAIYILREEYPDAEYRIFKAENQLGKEHSSILAIKGNLAAAKGNKDEARSYWEEAEKGGSILASKNIEILENKLPATSMKMQYQKPTIDQINLNSLYAMILRDEISPDQSIELDKNTSFYSVLLDNSEIYIHMSYESDEKFSFFHLVKNSDDQLPLQIGDSRDALMETFGQPDIVLESNSGTLCNYIPYQLIAVIQNGKIKKWCTYKLKL